jgi:hypothetical protein
MLCVCPSHVRNTAGEVGHPGVGLGRKARDLAARHAGIDAARPGPDPAAGQNQRHVLGAVFGHDQHPVPRQHAQTAQLGFENIHPLLQLPQR